MQKIRFYRQDALDRLRKQVKENLAWYRGCTDDAPSEVDGAYGEMTLMVDETCFDVLNEKTTNEDDRNNVKNFYEAFRCLSLQQAAEERIWAYATHNSVRQYTKTRWKDIPSDPDAAVRYINIHYFARNSRGLVRDNAIARLWWMGYLASRCKDYDLERTLEILLLSTDVRANLIERSSVSMSEQMFSGVIRVLAKYFEGNKDKNENEKYHGIYDRRKFRDFMKMVNRRGGRIMLNVLEKQQLDSVFNEMADEATRSSSTK